MKLCINILRIRYYFIYRYFYILFSKYLILSYYKENELDKYFLLSK